MTTEIVPIKLRLSMAYYICLGEGVLVDAGIPGEEERILRTIERVGMPRPGLIFITHSHFDHFGSAAALRRITEARIMIHREDAPPLLEASTPLGSVHGRGRIGEALLPLAERLLRPEPVQADVLLQDGDRLDRYGVPASVLHTPGHTFGSSTLQLDSGQAFVGDLLSATGVPHPQRYYAQDWSALGSSIRRLQACSPRIVYTGHGARPISSHELQQLG